MIIPKLSELGSDAYRADLRAKIDKQLDTVARRLATANCWRWDRCMLRSAIERWDVHELRFVSLDLSDFCLAIEQTFDLQTDDGRSLAVRSLYRRARLWEKCCQPGVLRIANYDI